MLIQNPQQILRVPVQSYLAEIEHADILVGIPCYNNQDTIAHVVQMVSQGLVKHYPEYQAVLLVADGGSIDQTREQTKNISLPSHQSQLVTVYQGISGKGSALRTIFAAAVTLDVQACICVDADLRSITPDWICYMLDPLLECDYDYVAPLYARYKYDGTITNNLVYPLTRALYGKRIRQPIGGDFAFAGWLARHYLEQPIWDTDVARFGIDIWMTLQAVVASARICQSNLGVKLHDAKDPASALGPMLRQVCGTLFSQIEQDAPFWSIVKGSKSIPTYGLKSILTPEVIPIDHSRLVQEFQLGFQAATPLYQQIFSAPLYQALVQASQAIPDNLAIPRLVWVRLLYELVAIHHHLGSYREALVSCITPLYLGQVASFMNYTHGLDFWDAEAVIESLAQDFERDKPYLLDRWFSSTIEHSQIDTIQHLLEESVRTE